jgi:lipopolysaccharide transport system ATP-binding protein
MSYAIRCDGLGKLYQIGKTNVTAAELLNQRLKRLVVPSALRAKAATPAMDARTEEAHRILDKQQVADAPAGHFWALKNVDLEVAPGDRVGIIGPNGCGKSTLLKILSRITPPTTGQFRFRGRLVSLLEIGTGFHGDLSGRENIFLNGSIMGMKPAEIRRKFDEIVDFSELGELIDTPVKRYSSGMYVRLAFSVAAHLESEILIVDEVLAVGDAAFQRKCSDKMLQVSGQGRTLIFVSHDMDAINRICNRAVRMEHGRVVEDSVLANDVNVVSGPGEQHSVADLTRSYIRSGMQMTCARRWESESSAPRLGSVRVNGARLVDTHGQEKHTFETKERIVVEIDYSILTDESPVNLHLHLKDLAGHYILVTMDNRHVNQGAQSQPGRYLARCTIEPPLLNSGDFRLDLEVWPGKLVEPRQMYTGLLNFSVYDDNAPTGVRGNWPNQWPNCLIRPSIPWAVERSGD